MANDFYNHDDGYPAFQAQGASAAMRAQLDKVQAGFNKMPPLTGSGNKIVGVNAGGTALESVTSTGTGNVVRATDPTFTLTDTTTNNVSTSQHGWTPKLTGSTAQFLRGDGNWAPAPTFSFVDDPRTTNTILGAADSGHVIRYTSGTFTQTISAVATLAGFGVYLKNQGGGLITLDPNGGELIDGAATFPLPDGMAILLLANSTATAFTKIILEEGSTSEVVVTTGNGFGSTNTKIRRFTTTQTNAGSAITYADSATLGGSFTINESGVYAMTFVGQGSGTGAETNVGISVNSAQLMIDIQAITAANRLGVSAAVTFGSISRTQVLTVGDVIRPHCGVITNAISADAATMFSIRKIKGS